MSTRLQFGVVLVAALAFAGIAIGAVVVASPSGMGAHVAVHTTPAGATWPSTTFVPAPPGTAKGPDDLTLLAVPGVDHGRPVIWTAYQNGVNPDGTAGSSGGPTWSTVAGYDLGTGALVQWLNVTGKVDGLSADPAMGALLATVNEDSNSALNVIYPALGAVAHYSYLPNPAVGGVGGTDSIAIWHGQIVVVHSNPNDTTQATDYLVTLHVATLTAALTPLFYDNSTATDAVTGASANLALTDPDTNFVMPAGSARFGGDLATISQGDGEIIFAAASGHSVALQVLHLKDNVSGNVPPIDGLTVATCGQGTLYVVDAKAGTITGLAVHGIAPGTILVGEPSDNSNPLVGWLNPNTGQITPFGNHFVSPKGLLFVGHCGGEGDQNGQGHDDNGQGRDDNGQGDDTQGDSGNGDQGNQGEGLGNWE